MKTYWTFAMISTGVSGFAMEGGKFIMSLQLKLFIMGGKAVPQPGLIGLYIITIKPGGGYSVDIPRIGFSRITVGLFGAISN